MSEQYSIDFDGFFKFTTNLNLETFFSDSFAYILNVSKFYSSLCDISKAYFANLRKSYSLRFSEKKKASEKIFIEYCPSLFEYVLSSFKNN